MKYCFNEGVNEQEFFYAWSPQSREGINRFYSLEIE